jgi:CRISPR-associated protein Csx3
VLRAYPDGEGDWANEADQALVRGIRVKGQGAPEWIARMCRDISRRHLPLIVDVGGQPTDWQEAVFDCVTHAILLTPDEPARSLWRGLASRHGVPLMADLRSLLSGQQFLLENRPILRGQITGLERGRTALGPVFAALVNQLATLFDYDQAELRGAHLSLSPAELVIELSRVGRALGFGDQWSRWLPDQLPALLDYLPPATPLAVYDRGPNWLYAALALYAYPAQLYQFDVRLGWVAPPALAPGPERASPLLAARVLERPTHTRLELTLACDYLDYGEAEELSLPQVSTARGVVLSGKLPLWLYTALALAYRRAPWVAVFQPQLHDQAVVIASQQQELPLGSLVTTPA